jgi:hypothetical protein
MSLLAMTSFGLPPIPDPLTKIHLAIGIGGVILGVAMALQGLRLIRWPMALAGGVLGLLLARQLQPLNASLNAPATLYFGAAIMAAIFFAAARFLTGLVGGALLALGVIFWLMTGPRAAPSIDMEYKTASVTDLSAWPEAFLKDCQTYLLALVKQGEWVSLLLIAFALLAPIALGVLMRKLTTIFITALLGALLAAGGVMVIALYFKWVDDAHHAFTTTPVLMGMGAAALVGFSIQVVTLPRHRGIVQITSEGDSGSAT